MYTRSIVISFVKTQSSFFMLFERKEKTLNFMPLIVSFFEHQFEKVRCFKNIKIQITKTIYDYLAALKSKIEFY